MDIVVGMDYVYREMGSEFIVRVKEDLSDEEFTIYKLEILTIMKRGSAFDFSEKEKEGRTFVCSVRKDMSSAVIGWHILSMNAGDF